jgi:hypothetical protein
VFEFVCEDLLETMLNGWQGSRQSREFRGMARPIYWDAALDAVAQGALTGRAIAKVLPVAERTLRRWRKDNRDFDGDLRDAMDRERTAQAERAAAHAARMRLWSARHFCRTQM